MENEKDVVQKVAVANRCANISTLNIHVKSVRVLDFAHMNA